MHGKPLILSSSSELIFWASADFEQTQDRNLINLMNESEEMAWTIKQKRKTILSFEIETGRKTLSIDDDDDDAANRENFRSFPLFWCDAAERTKI